MIKRAESCTAVSRVCPAKKDQRRFHDRKNQSQERDRDKSELNCDGAVLLAHETACQPGR